MKNATSVKVLVVLAILGSGLLLPGNSFDHTEALAQAPAAQREATPSKPPADLPPDPYDRNAQLWAHTRSGAQSGWVRGQELYYMNCWMCHSEYVIGGDHFPAPSLRAVSKRLSDEQITMKIKNGSARMPAFKQLTDADIQDLLVLFREKCGTFKAGGGCFDEHNPPPNPSYRYSGAER
jgi:mono/diheme cytochrome c family protein